MLLTTPMPHHRVCSPAATNPLAERPYVQFRGARPDRAHLRAEGRDQEDHGNNAEEIELGVTELEERIAPMGCVKGTHLPETGRTWDAVLAVRSPPGSSPSFL